MAPQGSKPVHTRLGPPIRGWIGFDFANSLIIINGILVYSRWLLTEQKSSELGLNLSMAGSTLLLFVLSPLLGAQLDRHRNGKFLLLTTSILLGVFTFALTWVADRDGFQKILLTLFAFGLINLAYQLSLVPYNWSLPLIA